MRKLAGWLVLAVLLVGFGLVVWVGSSAADLGSAPSPQSDVIGPITVDTVWTLSESPYVVTGDVTVNPGITLTVEAGVEVRFAGNYALVVQGTLAAEGTESASILFTSDQTSPAPGDWAFLDFRADSTNSLLRHTIVEYGGNATRAGSSCVAGAVCVNTSSFELDQSAVQHNATRGLVLVQSDATVTNNTFDDHTQEAIRLHGCNYNIGPCRPLITGNVFTSNASPVSFYSPQDPVFGSNQATGNSTNGLVLSNCAFRDENTWEADLPYVVPGWCNLGGYGPVRLNIEPGAVIKIDGGGLTLGYASAVTATGTAEQPVTVTSFEDDSVGGDTNNDGPATIPAPNDYYHVLLSGADVRALFEHTAFRYGGGSAAEFGPNVLADYGATVTLHACELSQSEAGVTVQRSSHLTIEESNLHDNSFAGVDVNSDGQVVVEDNAFIANGRGIRVYGGHPTASRNLFQDNTTAVEVICTTQFGGDCAPLVSPFNQFEGSSQFGIDNHYPAWAETDARQNWWGAATGPYHPSLNPSGTGNQVADGVRFVPWLAEFNWLDPEEPLLHETESLAWGVFGQEQEDLTVELRADGQASHGLGSGLAANGSRYWDTTAVTDGQYELHAIWRDGTSAIVGEAVRAVGVNNASSLAWQGGQIEANETWGSDQVHVVDETVIIRPGIQVTVSPGAIVKFAPGTRIIVEDGGHLDLQSTESLPTVLTSLADDRAGGDTNVDGDGSAPRAGDWDGLLAQGTGQITLGAQVELRYMRLAHSGTMGGDETWSSTYLHVVTDNVAVPAGATLTLEPGTVVKFDLLTGLTVASGGTLLAQGTSAQPVVLTSLRDDGAAGDSNGDGAATLPAPGDWLSLYVDGGSATLDHVQIQYSGGSTSGSWNNSAALRSYSSADLQVRNSTIEQAFYDGLLLQGGETILENCLVTGADRGLVAWLAEASVDAVNCTFDDNRIGLLAHGGDLEIANTIVANSLEVGIDRDMLPDPVVRYTNVWSGSGANYRGVDDQTGLNGNLSVPPRFKDQERGNYRLGYLSPMIDAADGAAAPETDRMGAPRYDDPRTENTGLPTTSGAYADLGAYEFVETAQSDLDLMVTAVEGPSSVLAGEIVNVTWTIANHGTGQAVGPWHDKITLLGEQGARVLAVDQVLSIATLGPNQSATFSAEVRVPGGTSGPYRWQVQANCQGEVFEGINWYNNASQAEASTTLDVTALSLGVPLAGTFVEDNAPAWFKITQEANEEIQITLDAQATEGNTVIYAGFEEMPLSHSFDLRSTTWASGDAWLTLPQPTRTRTVYLLVEHAFPPSVSLDYSLSAQAAQFSIYALGVHQGSNGGEITVPVYGSQFNAGLAVQLQPSAGMHSTGGPSPDAVSASIRVVDSTLALAVFDLHSQPTGIYDVTAQQNSQTATLDEAFTVVTGQPGQLEAHLVLPETVRIQRPFRGQIEYSNGGDADIPAAILVLEGASSHPVWLEGDPDQDRTSLQFLAVAPQRPSGGVLSPGEKHILDFSSILHEPVSSYKLTSKDGNAADLVDWEALRLEVQPADAEPIWDEAWDAMATTVGSTYADYIAALAAAADEALGYGVHTNLVDDLLEYMIEREVVNLSAQKVGGILYRLEDGQEEPYPLTAVILEDKATGETHLVESWYDGTFGFWDVGPGTYDLQVRDVLEEAWGEITVPPDGTLTGLHVTVDPGLRLSGRVIDTWSGEPIAGAVVTADSLSDERFYLAGTDSDGFYQIAGINPGLVEAQATAQDYGSSAPEILDLSAGEDATLMLALSAGGSVSGRILDPGGIPVAEAQVRAGMEDGGASQTAWTAGDGSYLIHGLPTGTYWVAAHSPGYAAGWQTGIEVESGATTEDVDVSLGEGGTVAGTVTEWGSGLSIAGATLAAESVIANNQPISTTASGDFTFPDLPPGTYNLVVDADGYLGAAFEVTVTAGGITTMNPALRRAGSVEGIVSQAGDGPLADVTVTLVQVSGVVTSTQTSQVGTFRFDNLLDGSYRLAIGDSAGLTVGREPFELTDVDNTATVAIELACAEVSGRVYKSDGLQAASGTYVGLVRDGSIVNHTFTDGDGHYRFIILQSGTVDLLAVGSDVDLAWATGINVSIGSDLIGQDIVAGAAALAVTVEALVGPSPVEDAWVTLRPADVAPNEKWLLRPLAACATDASGTCTIQHLMPGNYELSVQTGGLASAHQAVAVSGPSDALLVQMVEGRTIDGTVSDDGGVPTRAWLNFVDTASGHSYPAITDDQGEYTLDWLPASTFDLWASDGRHQPVRLTGIDTAGAAVQTLDVTMPSGGATISGTVTTSSGVPVAGAIIALEDASGFPVSTSITDLDGRYRLDAQPAGSLTLQVRVPGILPLPSEVVVPGAVTIIHDIVLDDAWALAGGRLPETLPGLTALVPGQLAMPGQEPNQQRITLSLTDQVPPPTPMRSWDWVDSFLYYDPLPYDCDPVDYRKRCDDSRQLVIDTYSEWMTAYRPTQYKGESEYKLALSNGALIAAKATLTLRALTGLEGVLTGVSAGQIPAFERALALVNAAMSLLGNIENWRAGSSFDLKTEALDGLAVIISRLEQENWPAQVGGPLVGIIATLRDFYNYANDTSELVREIDNVMKSYQNANARYVEAVKRHATNMRDYRAVIDSYKRTGLCPPPKSPPPPPDPRTPRDSGGPDGGYSWDPNDKATLGFGPSGWIAGDSRILYTIRFENQATATLPAQSVVITDQLDANLDWSTFHLEEVGFNSVQAFVVPAAPPTVQAYESQVLVATDPTPVHVQAALDPSSGLVTWEMRSIDPVTGGWPDDPLAGFLPPNDELHQGEGYALFSIRPHAGLANGTAIHNRASIVFDTNEPIITNWVTNTIDSLAPTSAVGTLPAFSPPTLTLSWAGDDAGGSGVATYDIYISADGGPFEAWQTAITETQATFSGTTNVTYGFYSVATDNVGHRQPAPAAAQITTTILALPGTPVLLFPPDGTVTTTQAITFTWRAGAGEIPDGYNLDLDGTVITTSATTMPLVLPVGIHAWTVRAYTAAGYSEWVTPSWTVDINDASRMIYLPLVLRQQ